MKLKRLNRYMRNISQMCQKTVRQRFWTSQRLMGLFALFRTLLDICIFTSLPAVVAEHTYLLIRKVRAQWNIVIEEVDEWHRLPPLIHYATWGLLLLLAFRLRKAKPGVVNTVASWLSLLGGIHIGPLCQNFTVVYIPLVLSLIIVVIIYKILDF